MWSNDKSTEFSAKLSANEIELILNDINNLSVHVDHTLTQIQTLFKNAADSAIGPECDYEIFGKVLIIA